MSRCVAPFFQGLYIIVGGPWWASLNFFAPINSPSPKHMVKLVHIQPKTNYHPWFQIFLIKYTVLTGFFQIENNIWYSVPSIKTYYFVSLRSIKVTQTELNYCCLPKKLLFVDSFQIWIKLFVEGYFSSAMKPFWGVYIVVLPCTSSFGAHKKDCVQLSLSLLCCEWPQRAAASAGML